MKERKIVGYIRTYNNSQQSKDMQIRMIKRYALNHGIVCSKVYSDQGFVKNRNVENQRIADFIGISNAKWNPVFPKWEELIIDIKKGQISTILVDTVLRLYSGTKQRVAIMAACEQYEVQIIEVGDYMPAKIEKPQLVIYHYTVKPEARTCIALNDVDDLYKYASQHFSGWEVALFLDLSDSRRKYIERITELTNCMILVKSYYHIKRHTLPFITMLRKLADNGVEVISTLEGKIALLNEKDSILRSKPLKVAIYDHIRLVHEEKIKKVQIEKFKVFINCKTNKWSISDFYIDGLKSKQQTELYRLIADRGKYDVVLIDTFGKIADTINCFTDFLSKINKPLYSLKEGEVIFIESGE